MNIFKEKIRTESIGKYFNRITYSKLFIGIYYQHVKLKVKITKENLNSVLKEADDLKIYIPASKYINLLQLK